MQKHTKSNGQTRMAGNQAIKQNVTMSLDQLFEKDVVCIGPDATVFEVAQEMLENHIGNIVVTEDKDGKSIPVGIVTDRDIVINALAKRLDPETVKVSEIMSKDIVTATEGDDLNTLVRLVVEEGVSRLPIVDDSGSLTGILSSKRLFQFFTQGLYELSSMSVQQQQREENTH